MSKTQITFLVAFWSVALIPLAVTLVIFVLTKVGVVATPIPDHYRGLLPNVAAMLTAGGWMGLICLGPAVGAGIAAAGIWVGILNVFNFPSALGVWRSSIGTTCC